jgi:asparagine synthase (glutamine-hydrolysing)
VRVLAGALRLDGAPLGDRVSAWLRASAAGTTVHVAGPVALSPAMPIGPATGATSTAADVPYIAAHARIDGRTALLGALERAGEPQPHAASAERLIAAAWRAWGEECVERLVGDFAFVIWEPRRRLLFAARDPFGVRHFYYSVNDGLLAFANRLPLLLACPGVSREPNEPAIADFLLVGRNSDPHTTSYRDVRCLPPGHALTVSDGDVRSVRFWSPPLDGEIHYRSVREYADHFDAVFGEAVADRLGGDRTSILMSGGRDSTAVAAVARHVGAEGLRAFTAVYDRLMPDEERRYATLAAAALDLPIEFLPVDGYRPFERWAEPAHLRPEPTDALPTTAADTDFLRHAAAYAPVALTGFGADAVLRESASRLAHLAGDLRIAAMLREAATYVRWHRRLPRPGFRSRHRRSRGISWRPPLPPWLAPDFARRVDAKARWEALLQRPSSAHPLRPEAHAQLDQSGWSRVLAQYAPEVNGVPIDCRHPFFDTRLVAFLLAVPPAQWYNDKGFLRILLARTMPAAFLRRQKTPLVQEPIAAVLRAHGTSAVQRSTLADGIDRFIDRSRLPEYAGGTAPAGDVAEAWLHLRPLTLSIWLEQRI